LVEVEVAGGFVLVVIVTSGTLLVPQDITRAADRSITRAMRMDFNFVFTFPPSIIQIATVKVIHVGDTRLTNN